MFSKVAAPFPGMDPAGGKSHRDWGRVRPESIRDGYHIAPTKSEY